MCYTRSSLDIYPRTVVNFRLGATATANKWREYSFIYAFDEWIEGNSWRFRRFMVARGVVGSSSVAWCVPCVS